MPAAVMESLLRLKRAAEEVGAPAATAAPAPAAGGAPAATAAAAAAADDTFTKVVETGSVGPTEQGSNTFDTLVDELKKLPSKFPILSLTCSL